MPGYDLKDEIKWDYPPYPDPFELTDAYKIGASIAAEIRGGIAGGPGCGDMDAALLAEVVFRAGHSDHLELGTLFGATAILVAMAKKEMGFEGSVYCVDNFTYLSDKYPVGPDMVMKNAEIFGVADRIKVLVGNTYPLPPDIAEKHFGSVYIDAAHDVANCVRDWNSVRGISDVVVFHDYDRSHMGVVATVKYAMQDPDWWLVHLSHHTAIFERMEKGIY